MGTIHLVSGPIGAGKTTKALEIVHDTKAVLMSPDNWMKKIDCALDERNGCRPTSQIDTA